MTTVGKYVTYEEATKSQAAVRHKIKNEPNEEQLEAMKLLCEKIHTPIREHFKKPIPLSSFFRCAALNKKLGGSATSQHMKGEAMDIDVDGVKGITNQEIFDYIKDNLEYDQLIHEYGTKNKPAWVHVSYKERGNRKQILYIK